MRVLGLKIGGHDTGAALIADGKVVAIAEERLSREKHTSAFPHLSIEYCLSAFALDPREIDLIVLDHTSKKKGMTGAEVFSEETKGRFNGVRIEMIGHHDAHAAAAFFCSPFSEAAILIYDGNGDLYRDHHGVMVAETETLYRGIGTAITTIHKTTHAKTEKRFPYTSGIGILYQKLSRDYIGFGPNNEGKMMGLAAYGSDDFFRTVPMDAWIGESEGFPICNADISFKRPVTKERLQRGMRKAVFYYGVRARLKRLADRTKRKVSALISGDLVARPSLFPSIHMPEPARDPKLVTLPDPYYSSVAYAAQKTFEEFARRLGHKLREITGSENLCVSGGCALNIDANRNFITDVGFKNLFVQPASSDCGIALGCALWGYHQILGQPRFWEMTSASLGKSYSEEEIESDLRTFDGKISVKKSDHIAAQTARLLADGKIVGWFQGGSEYGPRALGNRSILADARHPEMRNILNMRVKHRELWRPFATSILREHLSEWFDLETNSPATAFMLLCADVHKQKRALVPSIVHIDGTCRMQSLTKDANNVYYDLVSEFKELTGVPLIINTSFNLGGEPIVETPHDAIDTFLRTDMDYLVIGSRIIEKAAV